MATTEDADLLASANALIESVRARMERQAFGDALEDIWKVIRAGNAYIDHQAPWALKKTDINRMRCVLRVLVDVLRIVATLLQPFMPDKMTAMLDQLGVPKSMRQIADLEHGLAEGITLPAPQGVFPRFVEEAE